MSSQQSDVVVEKTVVKTFLNIPLMMELLKEEGNLANFEQQAAYAYIEDAIEEDKEIEVLQGWVDQLALEQGRARVSHVTALILTIAGQKQPVSPLK
jgi:hypothetical protein